MTNTSAFRLTRRALALGLAMLCIEALRPEGVAPFIYFQF